MTNNNWVKILLKAGVNPPIAELWAPYYNKWCAHYKIDTPKRISGFLANVMIECQYLRTLAENLNYSAQGLSNTWPNRYSSTGKRGGAPNAKALSIARNPVAIGNHCYANRMGNGDEASGDGYRNRGQGPLQITGRDNMAQFAKEAGVDILKDPSVLQKPDMGARSSCFYWFKNNINKYADIGDFDGCADIINIGRKTTTVGDAHGYANRKKQYDRLIAFFNANPKIMTEEEAVVDNNEFAMLDLVPDAEFDKVFDPNGEFTEVSGGYTKL